MFVWLTCLGIMSEAFQNGNASSSCCDAFWGIFAMTPKGHQLLWQWKCKLIWAIAFIGCWCFAHCKWMPRERQHDLHMKAAEHSITGQPRSWFWPCHSDSIEPNGQFGCDVSRSLQWCTRCRQFAQPDVQGPFLSIMNNVIRWPFWKETNKHLSEFLNTGQKGSWSCPFHNCVEVWFLWCPCLVNPFIHYPFFKQFTIVVCSWSFLWWFCARDQNAWTKFACWMIAFKRKGLLLTVPGTDRNLIWGNGFPHFPSSLVACKTQGSSQEPDFFFARHD